MLPLRQARFGAAEIDDDVRSFHAFHDAVQKFADACVKFIVDGVALGLAHLLQDDLLGRLRRDPAEHIGRLRVGDLSAHLDAGALFASFGERNFACGVGDFVDHRVDGKHVHGAGFGIELRADILFGAVVFPRRHDHRVFDRRDDDLGLDVLFPADLLDCLEQQTRHFVSPRPLTLRVPPPNSLCGCRRTARRSRALSPSTSRRRPRSSRGGLRNSSDSPPAR